MQLEQVGLVLQGCKPDIHHYLLVPKRQFSGPRRDLVLRAARAGVQNR